MKQEEQWSYVIGSKSGFSTSLFTELWEYKDLLWMFVKRDIVTIYKQTILGPLWFFIQPIFTTAIYLLVFNNIANLGTDGTPAILFYLCGISAWNYFAECLNKTSTTFKDNAYIFGKVYFPRVIMPLSIVVSNLIKFFIQFGLFLAAWCYFLIANPESIQPNIYMFLSPVLVLIMAALGLGLGMIITSLTTKYRDLFFLVQFGVQLLMYATPIIYPLSKVKDSKYGWLIELNPMTSVIETFKYGFLGSGTFSWTHLVYSGLFTTVLLFLGLLIFSKVEKSFTDTV